MKTLKLLVVGACPEPVARLPEFVVTVVQAPTHVRSLTRRRREADLLAQQAWEADVVLAVGLGARLVLWEVRGDFLSLNNPATAEELARVINELRRRYEDYVKPTTILRANSSPRYS